MQKPKDGLLPVLLFILSSLATVFLTVFCMSRFRSGFLYEHAATITSAAVGIELIYIAAALVFLLRRCKTVFKFMLTGLVLAALLLLILLVLQLTGLWERIDSVEGRASWTPRPEDGGRSSLSSCRRCRYSCCRCPAY